ncbi:MAG TPA: malto-oligosyltrehalose trehalohydrolase [Stellaceae bacterium]
MRRHHELPFGAELTSGGVRFRLWAPRARGVSLMLQDGPETPMDAEADGWFWLTTDRAGAGSRYRYRVDGAEHPDPGSRYQPEGVHGASEVIDPAGYEWRDAAWRGRPRHELVIYELHLGAFSERGGFTGAIAHLDHLAALGVTAVELMPVAECPGQRNWGYDGVQWFAPSRRYGRPEELKALVEGCHAREIAVLLDVVYNHFGPEGNYLHAIAPDFFTERHHTPWGAAINFDGPRSRPVRDFVVHNALYWLEEFHLDGLRLDAVHAIVDERTPDILAELAETVQQRVTDRPVHLILENDRNEARRLTRDYTAQWNDDVHHALHVLLTREERGYYGDYAERPLEHLGRALATGFAYQGEPSEHRHGHPRGEPSGDLPATAFVSFMQNHDQIGNTPFGTRIEAVAPEPLMHVAVSIVLLSPHIPLLFMGEEWASRRPFPFFCDFGPPLDEAVREGRRREFAHYPEFADLEAQRHIPDPNAEATFAAARLDWSEPQEPSRARWLERYRELLSIRHREIVPRLDRIAPGGSFRAFGPAALRVDWRFGDGSRLAVLANFAATPAPLAPPPQGRLLYCTGAPPGDALPQHCAAFYLLTAR